MPAGAAADGGFVGAGESRVIPLLVLAAGVLRAAVLFAAVELRRHRRIVAEVDESYLQLRRRARG